MIQQEKRTTQTSLNCCTHQVQIWIYLLWYMCVCRNKTH